MKVLTSAEMREADRKAIEEVGVPVAALMESAGRAVADAVEQALDGVEGRAVLVVCGRGNNGGDGLVAARHLANRGALPQVVLLGERKKLKSDLVRAPAEAAERIGVPLLEAASTSALAELRADLGQFDAVVDAIFGTGFTPPAKNLEAAAIEAINVLGDSGATVVAVDLPSGLDADSGHTDGPAVAADVTVALAAPKPAHLLGAAAALCGDLEVADIGIPRAILDSPEHRIELVEAADLRLLVAAPRAPEAHKGDFGHLLIVAGSRGKTGAAILAARAALRSGAALVTVATPASCLPIVAASAPELMTAPLPETDEGTLARSGLDRVRALLAERDALAIGPGLGGHPETRDLVRALLAAPGRPSVVDADGLNALAPTAGELLPRLDPDGRPVVITPHPGEAARLLGRAASDIQRDRMTSARELRERTAATVVLKGHHTLIAFGDDRLRINPTGNPAMATGGTGDALTGLLGGLLAQGMAIDDAATLAVYLHGLAADIVAGDGAFPSLLASDLIAALPRAFARLAGREDRDGGERDGAE